MFDNESKGGEPTGEQPVTDAATSESSADTTTTGPAPEAVSDVALPEADDEAADSMASAGDFNSRTAIGESTAPSAVAPARADAPAAAPTDAPVVESGAVAGSAGSTSGRAAGFASSADAEAPTSES